MSLYFQKIAGRLFTMKNCEQFSDAMCSAKLPARMSCNYTRRSTKLYYYENSLFRKSERKRQGAMVSAVPKVIFASAGEEYLLFVKTKGAADFLSCASTLVSATPRGAWGNIMPLVEIPEMLRHFDTRHVLAASGCCQMLP